MIIRDIVHFINEQTYSTETVTKSNFLNIIYIIIDTSNSNKKFLELNANYVFIYLKKTRSGFRFR